MSTLLLGTLYVRNPNDGAWKHFAKREEAMQWAEVLARHYPHKEVLVSQVTDVVEAEIPVKRASAPVSSEKPTA